MEPVGIWYACATTPRNVMTTARTSTRVLIQSRSDSPGFTVRRRVSDLATPILLGWDSKRTWDDSSLVWRPRLFGSSEGGRIQPAKPRFGVHSRRRTQPSAPHGTIPNTA